MNRAERPNYGTGLRGLLLAVALGATVLFGPTSAHASGVNVVPNPGFEQGGCGASTPAICGWDLADPISACGGAGPCTFSSEYQDSYAHTGGASLYMFWGTDFSDGFGGVEASTDPAFCVQIGPGAHPASFWYVGDSVDMSASFYQGAGCTGTVTYDDLGDGGAGAWKQVTGVLIAPPGTQSALFSVGAFAWCDYAGGCSAAANFDDLDVEAGVVTTPTIRSVTPTTGLAGTSVHIVGVNFTGATSVTFNGAPAVFTVDSDSEIDAIVPDSATTGPISITTPNGTGTSTDPFTITPLAPKIGSLTPTSGSAGTSIDILGTRFAGATGVTFNGAAAGFTVVSDSEIRATVSCAASTGPISVTTANGTGWSPNSFTVLHPLPTIDSFTPANGPVGTTVDILGSHFSCGNGVKFNGVAAGYGVDSDSEIHAVVPAGATTGPIAATTPSGTGTSAVPFTVTGPPPTIGSLTPTSGQVGTSVDIQGANLSGASAVRFNGTGAAYTVDSDSELHATVPVGATTGPISVTTANGTATSPSSFTVTANAPPSAHFTYSCTALTCRFDGGASSDPDGAIASYSWNFGDGTTVSGNPTNHNYVQPAGYLVTLTVTDTNGATATDSKTITLISLNAHGYRQGRLEKVDLSWSGEGGASFDVYRNGGKIATVQASAYMDNLNKKGPGTYAYKVCAGPVCSNTDSVSFP